MIDIILPVAILGVLIGYLHRLPRRLGLGQTTRKHRLSSQVDGWTVEITRWSANAYTTAYNFLPGYMTAGWSREFRLLYDVGSFAAVLGALVASTGLVWATVEVWRTVWVEVTLHVLESTSGAPPQQGISRRTKRAMQAMTQPSQGSSGGLQPLVGLSLSAHDDTLLIPDTWSDCSLVPCSFSYTCLGD